MILASVGWALMATSFMPYDDEGYVQWSLRQVAAGHPLYTEVFSQYGPFFYTLHQGLGKLGYPFTSDSARIMAGLYWLGTALGAGWLTRALSKSVGLGLAGFTLTFLSMTQMHAEPGHPGGLLALFSAWSACFGVRWIEQGRVRTFARWQIVIAACMLWTKINVGVLQLIAIVTWWPFVGPKSVSEHTRRWLRAALVIIGSGTLVMSLLQHREVQIYLAFFICAGGAMAWTWPRDPDPQPSAAPAIKAASWAFAITSVVSCGLILLGGTTLPDLINGTLLAPIRHPVVFHYLVPWQPANLLLMAVSAIGAVLYKLGPIRWRTGVLRAAKLLALVLLMVAACRAHFGQIERIMFMQLPLLAWALATPIEETDPRRRQARHWLGWLLCWSWLQSFPVAGTQYVWGSFLAIPLTLIGARDLVPNRFRAWYAAVWVSLALFGTINIGRYALLYWQTSVPLGLPGAVGLRLDRPTVSTYRLLVENARANGNMLFSFPGQLSFNQWSGLPPPTPANATHWFSLLNAEQQNEIILRLKVADSPVIIVCRSQIRYLFDQGLAPRGDLNDLIYRDFEPGLRIGDYDIWKRRGTIFTPVSCARIADAGTGDSPKNLIMLTTTTSRVGRIDVVDMTRPSETLMSFDRTVGWREAALPSNLQPNNLIVRRLDIPVDGHKPVPDRSSIEIRLFDQTGNQLDCLRFDHAPRPADAFTVSLPESTD